MQRQAPNPLTRSPEGVFNLIASNTLSPGEFIVYFKKASNSKQMRNNLLNIVRYLSSYQETYNFIQNAIIAAIPSIIRELREEDPEYCTHLLKEVTPFWPLEKQQKLIKKFENCYDTLIEQKKISGKDKETLLMEVKNELTLLQYNLWLGQFNKFGKLEYKTALLTCAQVKSKKPYEFNPTVLKDNDEFKEYLTILKNSTKPLRARFITTEAHWIVGDVEIDENGHAKLLLIDSLGKNSPAFPAHLIQSFADHFPERQIYFSAEKRQHADLACQMFTLDDVIHLFTLEKYLGEKYKHTGLFEYLKDHRIGFANRTDLNNIEVILIDLPLSLMRTKQKSTLFSEDIPRRSLEKDFKINKKEETALTSAEKSVREGKNMRLWDKMNRIGQDNAKYLSTTSFEIIQKSMQEFSLSGFKKRMENQSALKEKKRPSPESTTPRKPNF